MPSAGVVLSGSTASSQPTHWVSRAGSVIHGQTASMGRAISMLPRMRPASLRLDANHSPITESKATETTTKRLRKTHFIRICTVLPDVGE